MGLLNEMNPALGSKRLVALDLDGTLCPHRSPILPANRAALSALMARYACVMIGAGTPERIFQQMGGVPIDIVGNYGMRASTMKDGRLVIVKDLCEPVDPAFFERECARLREKYGYTAYVGDPVEFHPSGMVTFPLIGTKAAIADKLAFDPDRAKRRAMFREVCDIFRDYTVYIGGSSSFDIAAKHANKCDALLAYAAEHGFAPEEAVFIGDDFDDGGGDSHIRLGGLDYILVDDPADFPSAVSVLL